MRKEYTTNTNHLNENGSIIVLFAIMAIAIFAVIGLMIDTAMWSSAKTGSEQSAQFAALAALERYIETAPAFSGNANAGQLRMDQARLRASEVSNLNISTLAAVRQLGNYNAATIDDISANQNTPGQNGYLIPGIWHAASPKIDPTTGLCPPPNPESLPGQTCPCGAGNNNFVAPCFEAFSSNTNADINAMKVVFNTQASNPLKTVFSKVYASLTGQTAPSLTITTDAIATVVPRRAVFLLDLSGSMTEDTYNGTLNRSASDQTWGKYSYEVFPGESCVKPSPLSTPLSFADNGVIPPLPTSAGCTPTSPSSCFLTKNAQLIIQCAPFGRAPSENTISPVCSTNPWSSFYPPLTTPSIHTQKDYACVTIPQNAAQAAQFPAMAPESFLIDTNLTGSSANLPPEPLTGALQGINMALQTIQSRGVSADAIAVMGFDNEPLAIRATRDSNNNVPGLIKTNDPQFAEFLNATDTSNSTNKFSRFLFPRRLSSRDSITPLGSISQSDIFLALNLTTNMLNNDPLLGTADTHVILFSDGLQNCIQNPSPGSQTCDPYSLEYHTRGFNLIRSLVKNDFEPNNVHFSLFITGTSVAPHTLVRKGNASSACITDQMARETGTSFTDTGLNFPSLGNPLSGFWSDPTNIAAYQKLSNSSPWRLPNLLYDSVSTTQGLWVPLRPPCPGSNFRKKLDNACSSAAGNQGALVDASSNPALTAPVLNQFGDVIYPSAIDNQSRLLCDPDGRSKNQQVLDSMRRIFSQNPFLLVAE